MRTFKQISFALGILPALAGILYLRIMILLVWPHADQDRCIFDGVSDSSYQSYFRDAQYFVKTFTAEWESDQRKNRYRIPGQVIDALASPLGARADRMAATHAAMRSFGGVLVDQTPPNHGYTRMRYKIIDPGSFFGGCLIRCYLLQATHFTPQASGDVAGERNRPIAGGIVWPSWLDGGPSNLIQIYNAPPVCPNLKDNS